MNLLGCKLAHVGGRMGWNTSHFYSIHPANRPQSRQLRQHHKTSTGIDAYKMPLISLQTGISEFSHLVPAECGVQREEPVGGESLQLLAVDVVYLLVPAAEEEVRLAHRLTLRLLPRPLLQC